MDVSRVRAILDDCMGNVDASGSPLPDSEKVDIWVEVVLKPDKVREHADEMAALLKEWPTTSWGYAVAPLGKEITYLVAGGVMGDQGDALRLFAFGKLLDWWDVLEPASMLGLAKDDPFGKELAGMGMISIVGYRVPAKA